NTNKAALLTNDPVALKQGYIEVTINGITQKIEITRNGKLERFLGVHINFGNNKKQLINKIRQIVYNAAFSLKRKMITHDHIRYIHNTVIIPQIEYILQLTILNH